VGGVVRCALHAGKLAESHRVRPPVRGAGVHARGSDEPRRKVAEVSRGDAAVALPLLAVLIAVPHLLGGTYVLDLGVLTFLFVSQALAWNLLGGFAGQVSFGYAVFFGIGAYSTGVLWLHGWPPVLTYPVGALLAVVCALAIGLPAFRLAGPYFSIATLSIGLAMRVVALNADAITGGASGLNLPAQVPGKEWFYY